MTHDDKHKTEHAIGGDDAIVASDLGNDSGVSGASIKDALDQLDSDITAENIWNHAAGVITPQTPSDHTLDFSGATGSDMTIKFPNTKGLLFNDNSVNVAKVNAGSWYEMHLNPDQSEGCSLRSNVSDGRIMLGRAGGNPAMIVDGDGVALYPATTFDGTKFTQTEIEGSIISDTLNKALIIKRAYDDGGGGEDIVVDTAILGQHIFKGYDGATFIPAAEIRAVVAGTPGTNDMPGKLLLMTTKDGAAATTERLAVQFSATTELVFDHAAQASQPVLSTDGAMAIWEDTDDSNRTYIIVRTNSGDKKVELT